MFDIPAFEMNKIKVEQFYKTYKSKLLGLLFFLTSCANNSAFHPAVFPKSGHAELEVIGDPMEINLPLDIYVEGNSICVLNTLTQKKTKIKYSFILSRAKSDPKTGKFVSGTLYGAVLECFDLSNGIFDRIGLRLIEPPGVDMSGSGVDIKKGTKWGFSNFCLSEDRIYASFLNSDDVNSISSVSVFSWD